MMLGRNFISWRRVSTAKQRGSHLGLDAQKAIIDYFVEREQGKLIADYEECHSGTDLAGCTELQKAKEHCKRTGATLIIAKTDRCRDTIEALQLYEEMKGKLYFCDLPATDKFTLTLFFSLAEREATIVSLRTKQALKAKVERGERTGGASDKWRLAYEKKTKEQRKTEAMKRGQMKRMRYLESRDITAFIKVLKRVFPDETSGDDMRTWKWGRINTKHDNRIATLTLMRDYKELDASIFAKWDFTDIESTKLQVKLATYIKSLKESVMLPQPLNATAYD